MIAQYVLLHGAISPQVQDSAFVEFHEVFVHPFFQTVQIPLPDSPVDHHSLLQFDI